MNDALMLFLPSGWGPPALMTAALLLLSVALRLPQLALGGALAGLLGLFAWGIIDRGQLDSMAVELPFAELVPIAVLTLATLIVWSRFRASSARTDKNRTLQDGSFSIPAMLYSWICVVSCLLLFDPPPFETGLASNDRPWFLLGFDFLAEMLPGDFPFGVFLITLPIAAVCLPILDRPQPDSSLGERRELLSGFLLVWILIGLVPLWAGLLFRTSVGSEVDLLPFSTQLWERWTGLGLPISWWIRELPGILLLVLYFIALPRQLPRWTATRGVFGRYREELGAAVYWSTAWLLLWLLFPVVKLYSRWLLDISAFFYWPEGGFSL